MITIVIPTLNAAESLGPSLKRLNKDWPIIVSDGGSNDETKKIAAKQGAHVVECERGRGRQLHHGALHVTSEWIMFLHADTQLSPSAKKAMQQFIKAPDNKERVGYFRFKLDDDSEAAAKLERRVLWRCKTFALPYGDQGLLIHRTFYNRLGGYKDMALMEDVDLIWRIERQYGKRAIVLLEADATTSARRFKRDGYFKRSSLNLFCLLLFWIKVPPSLIAKLY